ncbi:hypothetical protein KKE34_04535 [Patescibacteria group bacterium]|nr:hypothetical protein [Patescibacteria group bacterium]MBU1885843.1 hypothetical protein [Patescibacteria group bacterium]
MNLITKVKRGDKSFSYFGQAFGVLTVILHSAIAVTPLSWLYKVLAILISSGLIFYFCYKNNWGKNKIVGFFSKIQDKVEVREY